MSKSKKKLNKKDMIDVISAKKNISKATVAIVVNNLIAELEEALCDINRTQNITLFGFGKFEVIKTSQRKCRNPTTGDKIIVEPYYRLKFTPCSGLKQRLKNIF